MVESLGFFGYSRIRMIVLLLFQLSKITNFSTLMWVLRDSGNHETILNTAFSPLKNSIHYKDIRLQINLLSTIIKTPKALSVLNYIS